METGEIVRLTHKAIREIIETRTEETGGEPTGHERRKFPRWFFPATVEVWPANGDGGRQWFGTCRDISEGGLGMSCDRYFEVGMLIELAVHLPEATLCGKGVVRYCQPVRGQFMVGVEFMFEE